MTHLEDRLSSALGSAYRSTFGAAPAVLPEPARGHGAAFAAGAGAVAVAAAVSVPLVVAHTGGTGTTTSARNGPAVLQTAAAGTPACGPGDVALSIYLNHTTFPASVLEQTASTLSTTAFVAYGIVTGTGATCRLYGESESVGFVTPSGDYLSYNGLNCTDGSVREVNRTGPAPTTDALSSVACNFPHGQLPSDLPTPSPPATESSPAPRSSGEPGPTPTPVRSVPAGVTDRPLPASERAIADAATQDNTDYGVLIGTAGTIDVPADGLGPDRYSMQLLDLHAGLGPTPEPTYHSVRADYVDDPYLIPTDRVEVGTWRMRITFGNQTVDVPFQVTAG